MEVLRPCGQAARSELQALWRLRPCAQRVGGFVEVEAVRAGGQQVGGGRMPAASWRLRGGVEAVRASCSQRVAGFVRPCGQAARSELEVLWRC